MPERLRAGYASPMRSVLLSLVALSVRALAATPDAGPSTDTPPGTVSESLLDETHQKLLSQLPEPVRRGLLTSFPSARVVAHCEGRFSGPTEPPAHALTVLESVKKERGVRVLRLVVSGKGKVVRLPWTEGATFTATDRAELENGRYFFGELRCVRPAEVPGFEKDFLPGFRKPDASRVDLQKQDSVCFAFDSVYNNWQCFTYASASRTFVRWGYQAAAD